MFSFTREANCKVIVDFQIPGSQESKTTLHGTIHHHKTLLSSVDLVMIFTSLFSFITVFKSSNSFTSHLFHHKLLEILVSLNSFREFHSLQKGHCHCHFRLSFQQLVHIYIIINLFLNI